MNVFYEEDGTFKVGAVLADQGGALQIEAASGKRAKVKNSSVLIEFRDPAPAALMRDAQALAETLELDFLWECAPADEFSFTRLGADYFGHAPTATEGAALLLRLHSAPMYFYRKGKGNYRAAPAESLKAALAGQERKRVSAALQESLCAELVSGSVPPAIRTRVNELVFRPDKSSTEYKALEQACAALVTTPARLMVKLGAFASAKELHLERFLFANFPRGRAFASYSAPAAAPELPLASVQAFSIDDHLTTEIDDAFSVERTTTGWTIGIHIAAPGLSIARGDSIDAIARDRFSTVYMPGDKITMLPADAVAAFTLAEGHDCPALSLYLEVSETDLAITAQHSRVERIHIGKNLRLNALEAEVTEEALANGSGAYPFKDEIAVLWPLAQSLYGLRQQARVASGLRAETGNRPDYNFYVTESADGTETVDIVERQRGSPLDKIVAELMIQANSTWGKLLADHDVAGIYRVQQGWGAAGRVRMQTHSAPHQGLGVAQYAWSTSPLRRYVDLVNQWQILACVQGRAAPFQRSDADLFSIVSGFEAAYLAYAEFQQIMERFWCLRWTEQQHLQVTEAIVQRDDTARLREVPLQFRVPGLPLLARGTCIEVDWLNVDEIDLAVECRLRAIIEEIDEEEAAAATDPASVEDQDGSSAAETTA